MFQKILSKLRSRPSLQATLLLIFWMFASRGLGVFRSALVGRLTTVEADIFNSGLILQTNVTTIFILGSIVIATLPQLTKLNNLDSQSKLSFSRTNSYLSWCILILSGFLSFLSLILIIFAPTVLDWFNHNLLQSYIQKGVYNQYILFNRIALLGPIFFGIKSILGTFLNVKKEFFIYSLEGILINLGSLLGLTIGYNLFGLKGVVIGVVSGMVFTMAAFFIDAYRFGFKFNLKHFEGLENYLLQTLWLYLPRLLVFSNIRAAETIVSKFATEANGQITAFTYALDIQGIFLGVMASVGTVFLPNLTEILVKKGQGTEFWNHLGKYLKISVYLSLAGTVITIFGTPVAILLFKFIAGIGVVKANSFWSTEQTSTVFILTAICASTLIFQSLAEILNRYFTAVEKVWHSIIASVSGNLAAFGIAFLFSSKIGVGFSAAIGFALNSVVLCSILAFFAWQDWKKRV